MFVTRESTQGRMDLPREYLTRFPPIPSPNIPGLPLSPSRNTCYVGPRSRRGDRHQQLRRLSAQLALSLCGRFMSHLCLTFGKRYQVLSVVDATRCTSWPCYVRVFPGGLFLPPCSARPSVTPSSQVVCAASLSVRRWELHSPSFLLCFPKSAPVSLPFPAGTPPRTCLGMFSVQSLAFPTTAHAHVAMSYRSTASRAPARCRSRATSALSRVVHVLETTAGTTNGRGASEISSSKENNRAS